MSTCACMCVLHVCCVHTCVFTQGWRRVTVPQHELAGTSLPSLSPVKDPFKRITPWSLVSPRPPHRQLFNLCQVPVNLPGLPPFPVSSEKFFTNSMVSGFSLFLSASDSPLGWALEGVFNALGFQNYACFHTHFCYMEASEGKLDHCQGSVDPPLLKTEVNSCPQ